MELPCDGTGRPGYYNYSSPRHLWTVPETTEDEAAPEASAAAGDVTPARVGFSVGALYRTARRKLAGLHVQEEESPASVPRGYDDDVAEDEDDEGVVVESAEAVGRAEEEDERALAVAEAAVAEADAALGEGGKARGEEEANDHGWLQRTFARTVGLYKLRGYGGSISVSVQLGFVAESISAHIAPGEPGRGDDPVAAISDSTWLESGEERVARLLRSLVARMERRAIAWSHVPNVPDPMLGSQGAVGLTLPFIKFAYSVSIALTVSRSSLLRWIEIAACAPQLRDLVARAATPDQDDHMPLRPTQEPRADDGPSDWPGDAVSDVPEWPGDPPVTDRPEWPTTDDEPADWRAADDHHPTDWRAAAEDQTPRIVEPEEF